MIDPDTTSRCLRADPVTSGRRSRCQRPLRGSLAATCLALFVASCGPSSTETDDAASGRTIVLISLDTLRPDRMGAYGGAEGVSPHVDALAADGVVFEQALAPAPWTLPSHMTMLTGLDPVAHGVHNGGVALSRHVKTVAEHLHDAGFVTAAFTDGGFVSRVVNGRASGMDQGFDLFDDTRSVDGINGMRRVSPPATEWIEDLDADEDAFLFVHTFDAHSPYDSPAEDLLQRFRARGVFDGPDDHHFGWLRFLRQQVKTGLAGYHRLAQLMNDYDAGVHQADLGVGEIVSALRATGRYDDALIIVTSDHGEAFLEHGLHVGHGLGHRDNELRVPLVAKLPDGEGASTRHDELVGLVDIARTVLETVGVEAEQEVQGESLLGLVRGKVRRNDWLLGFCNNSANGWIVRGQHKYVTSTAIAPMTVAQKHLGPVDPPAYEPSSGKGAYEFDGVPSHYDGEADPLGLLDVLPGAEQLYDRASDPHERVDLAADQPDLMAQMRGFFQMRQGVSKELFESLRDHEAEATDGNQATVNLDKMQERILAALGYVEGNVSIQEVPLKMRHWMVPRELPDTTALVEADRRVHAVRIELREGRPAPSDAADTLMAAAEAYQAWATQNPTFVARVLWRLRELETIATLGGVPLDTSAWR